ncbi:hypothetical protein M378DRAFT_50919, partial [Amanita muscaria Koide BX008]
LVAKTLIQLFDIPKRTADADDQLRELASNIEIEEMSSRVAELRLGNGIEIDDTDGWVDEDVALPAEERAELDESIRPLRLILVKVRKLAYKIVNSSTILLPAWTSTLQDLNMDVKRLPRDVSTRWNSTFDMLNVALEYRAGIDSITDKVRLGL